MFLTASHQVLSASTGNSIARTTPRSLSGCMVRNTVSRGCHFSVPDNVISRLSYPVLDSNWLRKPLSSLCVLVGVQFSNTTEDYKVCLCMCVCFYLNKNALFLSLSLEWYVWASYAYCDRWRLVLWPFIVSWKPQIVTRTEFVHDMSCKNALSLHSFRTRWGPDPLYSSSYLQCPLSCIHATDQIAIRARRLCTPSPYVTRSCGPASLCAERFVKRRRAKSHLWASGRNIEILLCL